MDFQFTMIDFETHIRTLSQALTTADATVVSPTLGTSNVVPWIIITTTTMMTTTKNITTTDTEKVVKALTAKARARAKVKANEARVG